jgi:amino acid transporter
VGTTARISYALGLPRALTRVSMRGVPIWSILLAAVLGVAALLVPGTGWLQLVGYITDATAIMYAFAPISLAALAKADVGRIHPYNAPVKTILLPLGFIFANLIIYWGGFDATWRLAVAILIGQVLFVVAALVKARNVDVARARWQSAVWIWPWLVGMTIIGLFGDYGSSELNLIPPYWDVLVVTVWSLIIFYFAASRVQQTSVIKEEVAKDLLDDSLSGGPTTTSIPTTPPTPGAPTTLVP